MLRVTAFVDSPVIIMIIITITIIIMIMIMIVIVIVVMIIIIIFIRFFQCIVKSYLHWLQDSDYNPVCTLCNGSLAEGDVVRLICFGKVSVFCALLC